MKRIRTTNSRTACSPHSPVLSKDAESLLDFFRWFRVGQGEMLCFVGPTFEKHCRALGQFTEQGLLVKERFRGGYALTPSGFAAMSARSRSIAAGRTSQPFEDHTPNRSLS